MLFVTLIIRAKGEIMADKMVHINFKIIKFDLTKTQFLLVVLATVLAAWISFTVAFSINTEFFSCNVKPVKIETDKVKIGTAQNKEVKKSK